MVGKNGKQVWSPPPVRHTKASLALGRILDIEESPMTIALRETFSRSELCRLRNGQTQPKNPTAHAIEKITRKRVTREMWLVRAKPTICQACGRP